MPRSRIVLIVSALLASAGPGLPDEPPQSELEHFEKHIRPLLIARCYSCHSLEKGKSKGELTLDTRQGWAQGGDSGPAIVPGKPEESLLIRAVRYGDESLQMPPPKQGGKLKDAEIAALEKWVRAGAPDPRTPARSSQRMTAEEAKTWWAFQPLKAPSIPPGKDAGGHPIDGFISQALKARGLLPVPPADRRTLIRRATFDLIGLPPTLEEVKAFLDDASPSAFSTVIERLLASPHYGEKWGRHWLDLVRYADSLDERSYEKDGDILDAWRYRDWVVSAFNNDLPYDRFIVEQIAGDILASGSPTWEADRLIATGMYAIGNWGNGDADKEKLHTDIVDDQIDVTSRVFLGVTLACARCHDHKFDPFTTRDYYALSGFFFSSHILERFQSKGEGEKLMRIPLHSPGEQKRLEEMQKRIGQIDGQLAQSLRPLAEVVEKLAGQKGLTAWRPKGTDNPSLVSNATGRPVAFGTIKLAADAVAVHPGPSVPVTAAWKSPCAGPVSISAALRDADPNCGDGIEWELRHGGQTLRRGTMDNGGSVSIPATECKVKPGELVLLIIRPRREYTCDTTEIELTIQAPDGKSWDVRRDLLRDGKQGAAGVWWLCSGQGETLAGDDQKLRQLEQERSGLAASLANRPLAQGMLEGGIPGTAYAGFHDARIHLRGAYNRLGDVVPRGLPAVLSSKQPAIASGSGRLELARWIADPANPLTARVMANRIWQHHFGWGLVRTPNNFGKLGSAPTHPELLDYLAAELIRSGWSIKALHRLIMTSQAYQRSSLLADPRLREAHLRLDPDNLLAARQQRRRLSAEEFRDAALAVAGELDPTLGGKAIRDLSTRRRTLYVTAIRSDRSNYQALFDAADPTAIIDQRTESTVAPQALWLLNHPFVLDRARALARRILQVPGGRAARVNWLCERLFCRPATADDLTLAERAVPHPETEAEWERLCQVLLCSNEFMYLD
jgi:hypothetical protein